jgi:antitoxin HicB
MVAYPAKLEHEGEDKVVLTLPDVPELVVVADGEEEALARAPELLDTILAGYQCEQRPLPRPSRIGGAPMVEPKRPPLLRYS